MEIHRPKPVHGWRDFLKEIGIIVLGVLIALAAEQVVETMHERTLRADAREAIGGEISRNLDIFRRRGAVQDCIDRRLNEVEQLLTTTPLGQALPRPLWIGRPQVWAVHEERLAAATSGARTALLPGDRQAAFGEIYGGFRILAAQQEEEQMAWAHLRALEILPSLDAQSRTALITALEEARYANFRILIASVQAREKAGALGLGTERSPYVEGSRSACVALRTSRAQALRLTIPGGKFIAEP